MMTQLINAKKKLSLQLIVLLFVSFFIISCNSTYTSKKPGYYKIDFPKRQYVKFEKPAFPYSFEYPVYATIDKDSSEENGDPFSININFPYLNGEIYMTYKVIGAKSTYKVKDSSGKYKDSTGINIFQKLVEDCYKLTYKNDIKAYSIEDSVMHTPNNITGIFFRLSGSVATAKQFLLSDTTHNFLRGALYFDATPNEDSLRPVNDFLQEDMKHIINTLKWK
jgi:gliding motility-associated lipoprotein GldD